MIIWVLKADRVHFCQKQAILALGGSVLDVSVCLLKSLGRDPFLWFL